MTECPDPSVLEGLFQGALTSTERAAIEAHIDRCPSCSATLAELARLFGSATWGPGSGPVTAPSHGRAHVPPIHSTTGEFGRYRLGRRLGSGGMGMVFEAEDVELHRRVALKILYTDPAADPEHTRARLMREARAMAQANHPNLVAVYEVGRVDDQVFLAMEFVEAGTLTGWLSHPRSRADILAAFVMAGRGLEAAHAAGLVHRDFKPDNALIGADGRVRVTDFGLALAARSSPDEVEPGSRADVRSSTSIMTERGAVVGTPAYMAPEQWRGQAADARSDQFSFCVALYEALVGTRPFAGDNPHALADAVLTRPPRPPGRELPRWLGAALLRGLARDPAARFASMAELLAVLERDREGPRRALMAVAAVVVVAAVAGGASAWATRAPSSESEPSSEPSSEPNSELARANPVAQTDTCSAAGDVGRGRWTDARREAVRVQVSGFDEGQALADALLPMLDGWIAAWTREAERSCRAPADALREAERRCLDAALARFDAMISQTSEHAGFEVAGGLLPAAQRLPELARCHDRGWLSLSPAPPPDELAGKVALVRRDLAAVEASVDLEQWVAARRLADDLITASEALGHPPLLAEAQLVHGRLELMVGETDAAIEWFEAAAETGTVAKHEQVVALAALGLVEALGAGQLRLEDARRWVKIVASLADRLDDAGLRGRNMLAEARALAAVAEHREALERLTEAEPQLRAGYGEGHPWLVEVQLARASSALATAQLDEAEQAAELGERLALAAVGPGALLTARAKAERARVALARGDLDQAERLATTASKIPGIARSRRHDLDRGLCLGLLGDIALAGDDTTTALARYRDAEIYLYAGPESALPSLWQGLAQLHLGSLAAGFAQLDAGWAKLSESWAEDDLRRLAWLRSVGLAALEAGELDRARVALERAVSLADDGIGFGPQLALAEADLGQLERAAGRPRAALTLLDSAYVGMVGGLGQHHPQVVAATLARADLAWELGDHDYAARLYGGVDDDLLDQRGADDPASQRALARRSQP